MKLILGNALRLIALILTAVAPLSGQTGSRLWRPEERVLVTDFSMVEAVAADENSLYVVSRAGIGMYDRRSRMWQPPVTVLDGYLPQPAASALIDPGDGSLWIATVTGLVHYDPRLRLLEDVSVAGGASRLAFDRNDVFAGIYFLARPGWMFLPRGGVIPQRTTGAPQAESGQRVPSVAEVMRRYPNIETMRSGVLVDDRLRSHRFTSAAEVRLTGDVFLGTDGLGVIRYDAQTASFEPIPFGLLTTGAAAVEVVLGGVWVAGDARSPRSGFTLVSSDLQRFEYEEGRPITGFQMGRVAGLAGRGSRLWAATDAGLVVVEPGVNPLSFNTADGLPSSRILSLAPGPNGAWVGTARGLAFVDNGGSVDRIGAQLFEPVLSLTSRGDTVWVGTRSGLGLSWAGSDRVVEPPGASGIPALHREIVDLTSNDAMIVATTREQIVMQIGSGGGGAGSGVGSAECRVQSAECAQVSRWYAERPIAVELGDLTSVAADRDGVWVGGSRGIAHYSPAGRAFVFFNAPGDVPGPVLDLAADDRYLWVATEQGLLRFDKTALRP